MPILSAVDAYNRHASLAEPYLPQAPVAAGPRRASDYDNPATYTQRLVADMGRPFQPRDIMGQPTTRVYQGRATDFDPAPRTFTQYLVSRMGGDVYAEAQSAGTSLAGRSAAPRRPEGPGKVVRGADVAPQVAARVAPEIAPRVAHQAHVAHVAQQAQAQRAAAVAYHPGALDGPGGIPAYNVTTQSSFENRARGVGPVPAGTPVRVLDGVPYVPGSARYGTLSPMGLQSCVRADTPLFWNPSVSAAADRS